MRFRIPGKWTLVIAAVAGVIICLPAIAESGAWFGVPLPAGLSDPLKPVMSYDDTFAPVPARFKHRPGKHDELLDGAALKQDLQTIIGFSKESLASGDKLWGRRATTPAFHHAIEWTVAEFKRAGISDAKAEKFSVPGTMWVPKSWQVQLLGDDAFGLGTKTITLESAFPQDGGVSTPAGGITAPLIFVGRGTDADLAGRNVKGKVAVLHVRPEPSLFGAAEQGIALKLAEQGAVGVLNVIEGPGNAQYYDRRFACGKAPCFILGGQDAWFVEQAIGKAANANVLDRLKAKLSLEASEQSELVSANAIATIPGERPERIIINAHVDAQFQGADDNASGLATLMGLARYLARQPKPKHTLMLVASGGHHGPGNGPRSLVEAHPELKDGTALVINLEHVAYSDVVRGKSRAVGNFGMVWQTSVTEAAKSVGVSNLAPFLVNLWAAAPRCFDVATYEQVSTGTPGDLGGYSSLKVPMTQMIQSGTFYHTSGDVYESVPAVGLERAARFFAYFIEKVDAAPDALIRGEGSAASLPRSECESVQ
jgi:hypothetical protein